MTEHSSFPSEEYIRKALEYADPMALRVVISLLSPDREAKATLGSMPLMPMDVLLVTVPGLADSRDVAWIRDRSLALIQRHLSSGAAAPPLPSGSSLGELFELAVGDKVPFEDIEYWREELAVDPMPRRLDWRYRSERGQNFHVLVIGAGFAGINAGIQLKGAGIPYTIIEKNAGVGGTWYQNHYPGARVDYPSLIYSYTFRSDFRWQHPFAPQKELRSYLEAMVDEYQIRDRIRFESEVVAAIWHEDAQQWEVRIRNRRGEEGIERANAIISAVGLFDRPVIPPFEGLASFKGPLFHSTQWDDTVNVADKHVAIVGSGATALQMAASLAKVASKLTVFQRTPPWMVKFPGYPDPLPSQVQWLYDNVPYYRNFVRLRLSYMLGDRILGKVFDVDPDWRHEISINATNERLRVQLTEHIVSKLDDRPDLIQKCLPKYPPLANRFVVDAGWYDALLNGSAELVAEAVERISTTGIVTKSGREVFCDVIVMATGFHSNDFLWPMHVVGRGGKTIRDAWCKDGGRAYLGMTVPGFPNLFMHYGPNSNPRAGTPPLWAEIQMRYILGIFKQMSDHSWKSVAVRPDVFDQYNDRADEILARSVWMDRRQKSYYRNDFGRVATNSPWKTIDYWRWIREPDMNDYEIV
jgi:4-hydroxyacetophenone monooxygenase